MLISVIVPIYNGSRTIKRCVDSILSQSYTDIEVILVNDGSLDGSGNIIDDYAQRDMRVKSIHKANGGLSAARNLGIEKAHGEYLSFVDADDWIEKDTYMKVINAISDADICVFGRSIDRPGGSRTWSPSVHEECISGEEALERLVLNSCHSAPKQTKRSAIRTKALYIKKSRTV